MRLKNPLGTPENPMHDGVLQNLEITNADGIELGLPEGTYGYDDLKDMGYDGIIYQNVKEDPGSISVMSLYPQRSGLRVLGEVEDVSGELQRYNAHIEKQRGKPIDFAVEAAGTQSGGQYFLDKPISGDLTKVFIQRSQKNAAYQGELAERGVTLDAGDVAPPRTVGGGTPISPMLPPINAPKLLTSIAESTRAPVGIQPGAQAVSYTHLTLPTILRV